jgi:hypothetical protein
MPPLSLFLLFFTQFGFTPFIPCCMLLPTFLFSTLLISALIAVRMHHLSTRLQPVLLPRR